MCQVLDVGIGYRCSVIRVEMIVREWSEDAVEWWGWVVLGVSFTPVWNYVEQCMDGAVLPVEVVSSAMTSSKKSPILSKIMPEGSVPESGALPP